MFPLYQYQYGRTRWITKYHTSASLERVLQSHFQVCFISPFLPIKIYCDISGVWEVPLNAHYVEGFEGGHCPYLDQCVLHNHDPKDVFEWLKEDFLRYYDQNRAPYMMAFHTNWFSIKELEKGLEMFLDWLTTL